VFNLVFTTAERALLKALNDLEVRYLIVGMGAALIADGSKGQDRRPGVAWPQGCRS
jgi:hypothetical protein